MKLFIDTWGWLSMRDSRESEHKAVKQFYIQHRSRMGRIYTTDYVLDETITLLFKRLPFALAAASLDKIQEAEARGYLHVEWITARRFSQAKLWRLKYHDKPDISFTDFTSMVVMEELGIHHVLTQDAHFEYVGKNYKCKP